MAFGGFGVLNVLVLVFSLHWGSDSAYAALPQLDQLEECRDSLDIAIFNSPRRAHRKAPLRVMITSETELKDAEVAALTPKGELIPVSAKRYGGPPWGWVVELDKPTVGTWRFGIGNGDRVDACQRVRVRRSGRVKDEVAHMRAEDVAQETFSRFAKHVDQWDVRRPLEPWLVAIAGNRSKTFLARRRAHQSLSGVLEPSTDDTTAVRKADGLREELALALAVVPHHKRLAFELFHEHGMSYLQISAELNCPVGTVRSRIFRAREFIEKSINNIG